jgi:hypothetical protein
MNINEVKMKAYGLPTAYADITWEHTNLSLGREDILKDKTAKAPRAGLVVIRGTAAPMVLQLLDEGRTARGISFTERCGAAFDTFENPIADVVVVYGVGDEISVSGKVTGQILRNLVQYYKAKKVLLILETTLTKSDILKTYDINAINFLSIGIKEEEKWV